MVADTMSSTMVRMYARTTNVWQSRNSQIAPYRCTYIHIHTLQISKVQYARAYVCVHMCAYVRRFSDWQLPRCHESGQPSHTCHPHTPSQWPHSPLCHHLLFFFPVHVAQQDQCTVRDTQSLEEFEEVLVLSWQAPLKGKDTDRRVLAWMEWVNSEYTQLRSYSVETWGAR